MSESCWFCEDDVRGGEPPGGWLIDDGLWRAGHVPADFSRCGTVILETRRHVVDQAAFTPDEGATVGPVTGRLIAAIQAVTGCNRVYQWATMDKFPHFHLWLLPWFADGPLRGPAYLQATIAHAACSAAEVAAVAADLRAALG